MRLTNATPIVLALAVGLFVGWIDVGATAIQGTLLLMMMTSFGLALVTRAPTIYLAAAVTVGLPLAHLMAAQVGKRGDPQLMMLIIMMPVTLAAYGGRGIANRIAAATSVLEEDNERSPESLSAVQLLGLALITCAIGGFVPLYATFLARSQPNAWWVAFIWQILTFIAWAVSTPSLFRVWQQTRSKDVGHVSVTELLVHGVMALTIAAIHATALTMLTRALHIPLGASPITEAIAWAFAAYLPVDALTYCLVMGLAHVYDANRRLRDAAQREAVVRGELASNRLSSLQAQLQPHFLFNALNAATVLSKRGDAARASNVLSRLSDLLRYVLGGSETEEEPGFVRLSKELAFVDAYLAIEKERFAERLRPSIEVDDDAREALVPHLVLQPLVENAIHHGVDAKLASGKVRVEARHVGEELILVVEDDGPGITESEHSGIGLSNTRSRLATLFGNRARLELLPRREGGTRASIVIPYTA